MTASKLLPILCVSAIALAGVALADPPKGAPKSLDDVTTAFDEKEEAARKALRRERWTAIDGYVKANASAKDVEEARKTLVDLAEELEDWARTVSSADAYLAAHEASKARIAVMLSRAGALANLGKDDEAKAAYEQATKAVVLDDHGVEVCFHAWSGYGDHLATIGDIEGAKKAYASGRDACNHRQVTQIMESHIANLEKIGTDATAFPDTAKDLEGKAVQVDQFKDKVLLIDFWATWCGPCLREMPHVIAAYTKYHDRGFEILGVTLDRPGGTEMLKEFVVARKMPWRQVYYPEGENEVATAYGVDSIPHTVLVGRDGKVVRIGLRGPALGRAVERLLAAAPAKPK
jgi:thiol-disulfide isomerase/thioredoxin